MQLSEPGSTLFRTPAHSASKICVLLLSWSSTSCGVFFKKEVFFMEAATHTYTKTYTSHLRQKIRKETKKEKKIFAEDYGLKGDPRLLAISQAIRVVSQISHEQNFQAIRLSDMVTFGHYLKGDISERKDSMNFDVKEVRGCQLSSKPRLWCLGSSMVVYDREV
ncbi:hypothetical protein S245_061301 [Arachis hypogaea]